MNEDIEYFAPWAVTKDNAQEALANASDLLIRWREDSDRDGQWAEDTVDAGLVTGRVFYGGGSLFAACTNHVDELRASLAASGLAGSLREDVTTTPFDGGRSGYRCGLCEDRS